MKNTAIQTQQTVYINSFTNGILDPKGEMGGVVKDGGYIIANTTPGCWGPMLTPCLRGGHEVTKPIYVEGAEVGDAIAIHIKSIKVTSIATASGNSQPVNGRFIGDPFVAAKCPTCNELYPKTIVKGIGSNSIHCTICDTDISPFILTNGYTMVFDDQHNIGVTVPKESAEKIAADGRNYMATPPNSIQNPVVSLAPHHISGTISRLRPFLGQLGTLPSRTFPDSHNAGDFGTFLINAPHEYSLTEDELKERTDGHMDISRVREGAILICPVKVKGGGVYIGDMHAMQGDGEIAGHTTDVAGIVSLQVNVIKNLSTEGPILLPVKEDIPYLAQPFTKQELKIAEQVSKKWGIHHVEKESLPVAFIGTGANLNEATTNGLERAAELLGMSVPEVMNRATINGSIEIGRHPGVVTVTFLVPTTILEKLGILPYAITQYCQS